MNTKECTINELINFANREKNSLEIHDSFGDGYLLNKNPIYYNIRKLTLEKGFKYVTDHPTYFAAPVMSLPTIVRDKVIPYRDNVTIIEKISKLNPNLKISEIEGAFEPRHGHIYHESTHLISYEFLSVRPGGKYDKTNENIFKLYLSEAIAQTVDLLTNIYATTQSHKYILALNHYWELTENEREALFTLNSKLGPLATYHLLVALMLFPNFMLKEVDEDDWQKIDNYLINEWNVEEDQLAQAKSSIRVISKNILSMDSLFIYEACQNFFTMEGFNQEVFEINNFDPLESFLNMDSETKEITNKLGKIILGYSS